jgi:molybdate transport system ATP-binding protein
VTALFGNSGSGKTTVLRCLAGLERAPDGYLIVNGEVWQDEKNAFFLPTHHRPLGYVFQEASLFPHMNVRRNLEYGWKRIPAAERRVSFEQAVELVGIAQLLDRITRKSCTILKLQPGTSVFAQVKSVALLG